MENLDDYLEKATHLPATPTILINLMALLRKVDTDIDEVVELISMDPSITAGVIQLCNSAMFGGSGNISDIEGAVAR
jgi:HD-like signal output (HDOD) protein